MITSELMSPYEYGRTMVGLAGFEIPALSLRSSFGVLKCLILGVFRTRQLHCNHKL
jgi:hypothetical protein